jgi:hypothetical protein
VGGKVEDSSFYKDSVFIVADSISIPNTVLHEIETALRVRREQTDRLGTHLLQHGPALYPDAEDTFTSAAALADLRRTVTAWRGSS